MNKKTKLLALLMALCMVLGLAGCGSSGGSTSDGGSDASTSGDADNSGASDGTVYTLRVSSINPSTDNKNGIVLAAWANWLDEQSGGRIVLEPHYSNEACAADAALSAVQNGIVDIAEFESPYYGTNFPLNELFLLPMVFEYADAWTCTKVIQEMRENHPEFEAEFSDQNVMWLMSHNVSASHFFSSSPIRTMEDMNGKIINAFSGTEARTIELLGGTAELLGAMDCYDAQSKGVLNATAVPYTGATVTGVLDASSSVTEVGLCQAVFNMIMNVDTYNSLPSDLQALFSREKMKEFEDWYGYQFNCDDMNFKNQDAEISGFEIITLSADEKARWQEAIAPIYDEWIATADAAGVDGQALFDELKSLSEKYSYQNYFVGEDWSSVHDSLQQYYGQDLPEWFTTTFE